MSVFIVTTHQFFKDHPRGRSWLPQYSPHSFINENPLIIYYPRPIPPTIRSSIEEDFSQGSTAVNYQNRNSVKQPAFPDAQGRIKGFSQERHANLDEQSYARFLPNFFTNNDNYNNLFFKTAMFTSRVSVSLTSFVTCVPSNQVSNGAAATTCRRKRNVENDHVLEDNQFQIKPTETVKLMPTDFPSQPDRELGQLSSSKDGVFTGAIPATHHLRKRFLFVNKNQFVLSSTVTLYSFTNTTITVTRNLLNPAPAAACLPVDNDDMQNTPQCVACLPAGYVVCAANGGTEGCHRRRLWHKEECLDDDLYKHVQAEGTA
ncbi:hypothetical protein GHT06_016049 [Daphnia sinensis]|uniref:Uncharacterized protein n=1 Tax=Daphnia sinensis TaxID=1820382 RepID=A0AAD5PXT1_9CRUS|nr:hypothetical protein GHT06_016049 [Daphnia sinensis]